MSSVQDLKMEKPPRLVILYASQTGTAEDCAERIGREAARRHYSDISVMACDDYKIQDIFEDSFFLFVIATTGQGDNPDNMKTFFRHILRKQLEPGDFAHMSFAVCGLGDSSYQKFNYSAKKVFRRLQQLGANSLLEPVYADEQHDWGVDGLIDPWLEKFWEATERLRQSLPILPDQKPSPRFTISPLEVTAQPIRAPSPFRPSLILSHERLTPEEHFQDVRSLVLKSEQTFTPGDVVAILPKNSDDTVEEFLSMFPFVEPDKTIQLTNGASPLPEQLKVPTTFRKIATSYLDLNAVPKRSFFGVFKHFCDSNDDLLFEKFNEFSRAEGQPDLIDYSIRPKRTIVEVLADFPGITRKLQIQDLLTLIPAIRPRYYSIANSSLMHPGEIHILYAVVDFNTMLKKPRTGLCTSYLKNLNSEDTVNIYVKKGTLDFPAETSCKMIMVGPGTGVAPFRAFIQEQVARGGKHMTLFFGCRNANNDYFFADEWHTYEAQGQLKVLTAFSRDQMHKVYVQHRIKESRDLIEELADDQLNCRIFICGNAARMVGDVLEVFEQVLGKQTIEKMQTQKTLQIEAWA